MSEKSGILKKVKDGFIESYTKQKEHDKENFKLEKQLSKARHEEAIKPNPDFVEFKESKGLIEKTKTIGRQIKRSGSVQNEKNRLNNEDRLSKKQVELDNIYNRLNQ